MSRSHIHGFDAGLAKDTILHHPWQSVFRDYFMAFWLSPEVSTPDPITSLRALAGGLIMVEG